MQQTLVLDQALINRYDQSGPRYTSYPTAVQFHDAFGPEQYRAAARASNASGRPLSLYFHIPFCDTVCFYCACNKIATKDRTRAQPYLDRVHREIAMQAELFDASRPVEQLHWGGGTPTFISPEQMRELMTVTGRHFHLLHDDSGEYSIEIDPREVTDATIGLLREIGFNRMSLGLQDLDDKVQALVDRTQVQPGESLTLKVVVGGGDVALRKARLLHGAGARVIVVAPETSAACGAFLARHRLEHRQRRFAERDVEGAWLVVSATGDDAVDAAVHAAASRRQVFCNSVDNLAYSSYITPAIVDRSPLVVAISSGGAAPVLARTVREKIETLLPADFGRLAELAGRWRDRVKATVSNVGRRRRFWETLFASDVPDLAIGGQYDRAERRVAQMLLDFDGTGPRAGRAWLVGAGPGDPDLLTVRALRILQTADVIVHDRLVSEEVLALARRDADFVSVGKIPGGSRNAQEDINALLVKLVRAGKDVCRLKGGDPFVFARGGEELEALHDAGLGAEVVPGITAAAGCAAYAGIPLTHRDASQSVVFAAAHGADDDLDLFPNVFNGLQ